MQIPRGTFRDLKKGIHLGTLVREMQEASFSGYCKIATGGETVILVFDKGTIVLANAGELEGDAVLPHLRQLQDTSVDTILHDLSGTQLKMTLEFNRSSIVREKDRDRTSPVRGSHVKRSGAAPPSPPPAAGQTAGDRPAGTREIGAKDLPQTGKVHRDTQEIQPPPPDLNRRPASHHTSAKHGQDHRAPHDTTERHIDDESALLLSELDTLDTIQVEIVEKKFRESCRKIIEKLELEHLIDEEKQEERNS